MFVGKIIMWIKDKENPYQFLTDKDISLIIWLSIYTVLMHQGF